MDLAAMVDWYAFLWAQPGWGEYVEHRVKQLAREDRAIWGDLPRLVKERVHA